MKRLAIITAALVLALGAIVVTPPKAEARRGSGALIGGMVAAAVIGGVVAASYRSNRYRSYGYYPHRSYAYAPAYSYYQPAYVYRRPVYAYRPVRVYRSSFYAPRRVVYRSHYRRGWRR